MTPNYCLLSSEEVRQQEITLREMWKVTTSHRRGQTQRVQQDKDYCSKEYAQALSERSSIKKPP